MSLPHRASQSDPLTAWLAGVVDTPEFTGSIVAPRGWKILCLALWLAGVALMVAYGRITFLGGVHVGAFLAALMWDWILAPSPFIIGAFIPAGAIYLGMLQPALVLNLGGAL